jgi:hypothetical protein
VIAKDIRALALAYPVDGRRLMHRTKIKGKEAFA